jgi:hypothetical protein
LEIEANQEIKPRLNLNLLLKKIGKLGFWSLDIGNCEEVFALQILKVL